jgi:hypothetical protein
MPDITRRALLAGHTDFGTDSYGGFCPSHGDKPHRSILIVMQSMKTSGNSARITNIERRRRLRVAFSHEGKGKLDGSPWLGDLPFQAPKCKGSLMNKHRWPLQASKSLLTILSLAPYPYLRITHTLFAMPASTGVCAMSHKASKEKRRSKTDTTSRKALVGLLSK